KRSGKGLGQSPSGRRFEPQQGHWRHYKSAASPGPRGTNRGGPALKQRDPVGTASRVRKATPGNHATNTILMPTTTPSFTHSGAMKSVRSQPPLPPLWSPRRPTVPDFQGLDFPAESDSLPVSNDDESEYYVCNESNNCTTTMVRVMIQVQNMITRSMKAR
ncbi:hypothetical protein MTR67_028697, partial [Solanum verrucosum]